jgi:putative peptidoglycan lipid II flippase
MNDSDGLQNVVRSTGIISVAIMVSRVLGLVREQVVAYFFGSTVVTDAFYAAFRIPNLVRDLFGGGGNAA